jgi:hypothetical protein
MIKVKPSNPGSAGCRQVHQALRGGRRSLEHECSFLLFLFTRQIYFLFFSVTK